MDSASKAPMEQPDLPESEPKAMGPSIEGSEAKAGSAMPLQPAGMPEDPELPPLPEPPMTQQASSEIPGEPERPQRPKQDPFTPNKTQAEPNELQEISRT